MSSKKKTAWKRILFWSASALVALLLAVTLYLWFSLFDRYTHPGRMTLERTPADMGLSFERLSFITHDGLELQAWLVEPPAAEGNGVRPAALAIHGYGTNRDNILERVAHLAHLGFVVLCFDHRGSGDSEGDVVTGGIFETRDAIRALDLLLKQEDIDEKRVLVYGYSMGGVVAIAAAARHDSVDAVIVDSPYASLNRISQKILKDNGVPLVPFMALMNLSFSTSFGASMKEMSAVEDVARLGSRPFLIIGGSADTTVPMDHFFEIFAAATPPAAFRLLPAHEHEDNGSPVIFQEIIKPFLVKHRMLQP